MSTSRQSYLRSTGLYLRTTKHKPLLKFERADEQSLAFSARQEPHNFKQLANWLDYLKFEHPDDEWFNPWGCKKRLSDSPPLKSAVLIEQSMVVTYYIRQAQAIIQLTIPKALIKLIITYYAQPAIFPVPRLNKYQGPSVSDELSWKIHANESLKDKDHADNKEDDEAWVKWKANKAANKLGQATSSRNYERKGLWVDKKWWHPLWV